LGEETKQNLEFVFGGSFDPVHNGHLGVIRALIGLSISDLSAKGVVRIIPCARPALKAANSLPFAERVKLLELALSKDEQIDLSKVTIDTMESLRSGPSYMIDSLRTLCKQSLDTRYCLVIGADLLDSLEQWKAIEEFHRLCHLVVVNRPMNLVKNSKESVRRLGFEIVNTSEALLKQKYGQCFFLAIDEINISSTELRNTWANNSRDYLENTNLPDVVYEEIKKNGWYR